ncbi:MAG: hypothetical protein R6V12_01480 [Candidatus Hydrogenedentota bacterium]
MIQRFVPVLLPLIVFVIPVKAVEHTVRPSIEGHWWTVVHNPDLEAYTGDRQ